MDKAFKQHLKARAHHLKPVILLGSKGLTPAVVNETHQALLTHELIKLKLTGIEKQEKEVIINDLCRQLQAQFIQLIGHTVTLYRKNDETLSLSPMGLDDLG